MTVNEAIKQFEAKPNNIKERLFTKTLEAIQQIIESKRSDYKPAVLIADSDTQLANTLKIKLAEADIPNIIGNSKSIKDILTTIEKVAQTDSTVLITGESGTGKELVARAIHYLGKRKVNKFVPINCSAFPDTLLESELFGHEKGAFTGAQKRAGKFKFADGGTIFFDEVGDMSPAAQAKVLRVLERKEFEPLGCNTSIKVDVRIIAATNKDLKLAMSEDTFRFRKDLFYRLNVINIHIPPLRERMEDVPLLVEHFNSLNFLLSSANPFFSRHYKLSTSLLSSGIPFAFYLYENDERKEVKKIVKGL